MTNVPCQFVLGSRSPRRRELLGYAVPAESIRVLPPRSSEEAGFEQLHDWPGIERRLREIARDKCADVLAQLQVSDSSGSPSVVITADTTIVASGDDQQLTVLGQPPEDETWPDTVRTWFRDYYAGRTHRAATAICVAVRSGHSTQNRSNADRQIERVVQTEVGFISDVERWLDWYIGTGEPRGKAGGYAIQGAASLFVSEVRGSISNVVGLPLMELMEMFAELSIPVDDSRSRHCV